MTGRFNFSFYLKVDKPLNDTVIAVIFDGSGAWLQVGYEAVMDKFYLRGSDGRDVYVDNIASKDRDWLTIAISQGLDNRKIFIHSLAHSQVKGETVSAEPLNFSPMASRTWKANTVAWKDKTVSWKQYSLLLYCYLPEYMILKNREAIKDA